MQAKLIVNKVAKIRKKLPDGRHCEEVSFAAHFDGPLQRSGRSFAIDVPAARLQITVTNPRFVGVFQPGQLYDMELLPVLRPDENVAEMPRAA